MSRDHSAGRVVALVVIALAALYMIVAGATFAFRHPWMTSTERTLWIGRALSFGTVTQDEVRGR